MSETAHVPPVHPTRNGAGADEWSEPVPLDAQSELPLFPVAVLPSWLRDWVIAEATATQTPSDLPAMLALAVVATACQRFMDVGVRDGWTEPPSIYTAPVLPPGSRKSAVMHDAREPLDAHECEQAERLAPEIERSRDVLAAAKKRHERAIEKAAKTEGPARPGVETELREARADLTAAEDNLVVAPQLSCGDCTQEALAHLLHRNGECMALLDAEGCGPLAIMLGRYSDGAAAFDLYLRAHAGDVYRCDRLARGSITLRRPAMTMAVTVQPDVLRQVGQRREMRGLGLLARILWVVPVPTVGRRKSRPDPMPEHVREAYAKNIRVLLALGPRNPGERQSVRLSGAADDMLAAWSDRLESRLGVGGELEHVVDWASKLAGTCARIAGLLHAADHTDCPWATTISPDTMRVAIEIGEYLLAHAVVALNEMGTGPVLADARHILRWLRARDVREISRRDLWHAMRGRYHHVKEIEPALTVLRERGWIRELSAHRVSGPGRPSSPILEVSPFARRSGPDHNDHSEQNDQNDQK